MIVWNRDATSLRCACNLPEVTQGAGDENTERAICVTYNQVFFLPCLLLQGDSTQSQTSHKVISKERIHHIQSDKNLGFSCKYEKTKNQLLWYEALIKTQDKILKFFIHSISSIALYFTPDYLKFF